MVDPTSAAARKMIHTCRHDPRSLNINSLSASTEGAFYGYATMGSSFVQMELRQAREVAIVRIKAPGSSSYLGYALRDFRLEYSDDGAAWTTALTVSGAQPLAVAEWHDYTVPGTPGAHQFWRIMVDSTNLYTTGVCWSSLLLIEADGTVANHFGSEIILKAPGLAGTDEIFIGIRSEYSTESGWYNLFLNGYSGYDPNETSWFEQPGALPPYGSTVPLPVPMVPCWNLAMPYWFAASGRCFRFGVKVSTNFEGAYLGFMLPYAMPQQYPYPLVVGGSLVPQDTYRLDGWRYSYVNWRHGVYPAPGASSAPASDTIHATLYMRDVAGIWKPIANRPNNGSPNSEGIYGPVQGDANTVPAGAIRSVWPHCMNDKWSSGCLPYRECLGGGYMPQPCIVLQRGPEPAVLGELEGTFVISGYDNAAENTTTINGIPAVIFQNAYRNSIHEFWALTLDN